MKAKLAAGGAGAGAGGEGSERGSTVGSPVASEAACSVFSSHETAHRTHLKRMDKERRRHMDSAEVKRKEREPRRRHPLALFAVLDVVVVGCYSCWW